MTTWKHGTVWKDGKLYYFKPTSVLVMRLWPEMLAWRRTRTKPWQPTRKWADQLISGARPSDGEVEFYTDVSSSPTTRDLSPASNAGWPWPTKAILKAYATIPARERRLAFQLRERQWHALAMMARCPGATDLHEANPALAFALASNWVFHQPAVKQPMRAARALLKKRQVVIMEWLGFAPTEQVRRILAKVRADALDVLSLLALRRALNDPELRRVLAHLPVINGDILSFVGHPQARERLEPRFLHQLAEISLAGTPAERFEGVFRFSKRPYFDAWRWGRWQTRLVGPEMPAKLRTLGQLRRWHRWLVEHPPQPIFVPLSAEERRKHVAALMFGAPPFAGAPGIEPLCSGEQLLAEGDFMRHCVASFADAVMAGYYYVYRITAPVRGTVSIVRDASGWRIDQICGPSNAPVPKLQQEAIELALLGGYA